MKIGLNKVTLMGNIVRELELRYTMNKKAFLQFTVACNYSKRTDGAYETAADFIPCVAWGKLAETIAKYFQKGSPIYLEGKVKVRSYEKDGVKKYVTEILADLIRFIGETRKDVEPQADPGDEVSISQDEQSDELLEIQFN
ncbi:MAG: single-stranded DNA-binding protein [Synergistaceae bacterium]|nr:single-stranded DNA-binding protein [Synergistaceae bacterium]